jgi:hypothetical protein
VVGELQFYEATSQVIPVLFLALVVEQRATAEVGMQREEDVRLLRRVGLALGLVFAVGEGAALWALFVGEGNVATAVIVIAVLVVSGIGLLGSAALVQLNRIDEAAGASAVWVRRVLSVLSGRRWWFYVILVLVLLEVGGFVFDRLPW